MMVTEEQAKEMWCPAVRVAASNIQWLDTRGHILKKNTEHGPRCIASKCMWWRWADKFEDTNTGSVAQEGTYKPGVLAELGFCGMAGKP